MKRETDTVANAMRVPIALHMAHSVFINLCLAQWIQTADDERQAAAGRSVLGRLVIRVCVFRFSYEEDRIYGIDLNEKAISLNMHTNSSAPIGLSQ